MRIDIRNDQRQHLARVKIDLAQPIDMVTPSKDDRPSIRLNWDQALNSQGQLVSCPVCQCRELYARRDFPHVAGMATVAMAAAVAIVMFAFQRILWGVAVLGGVAMIDALIYPFTKRCLVCYRCRSEFRHLSIPRDHPTWDLATGEKYRPVRQNADRGTETV